MYVTMGNVKVEISLSAEVLANKKKLNSMV
jgi:hypothetical protein